MKSTSVVRGIGIAVMAAFVAGAASPAAAQATVASKPTAPAVDKAPAVAAQPARAARPQRVAPLARQARQPVRARGTGLNLTEEQRTTIKGLRQQQQAEIKASRAALKAAREKVREARNAEAFDEKNVRAAAMALASAQADLTVLNARHRSQYLGLLSPEQRELVKQRRDRGLGAEGRMADFRARRMGAWQMGRHMGMRMGFGMGMGMRMGMRWQMAPGQGRMGRMPGRMGPGMMGPGQMGPGQMGPRRRPGGAGQPPDGQAVEPLPPPPPPPAPKKKI